MIFQLSSKVLIFSILLLFLITAYKSISVESQFASNYGQPVQSHYAAISNREIAFEDFKTNWFLGSPLHYSSRWKKLRGSSASGRVDKVEKSHGLNPGKSRLEERSDYYRITVTGRDGKKSEKMQFSVAVVDLAENFAVYRTLDSLLGCSKILDALRGEMTSDEEHFYNVNHYLPSSALVSIFEKRELGSLKKFVSSSFQYNLNSFSGAIYSDRPIILNNSFLFHPLFTSKYFYIRKRHKVEMLFHGRRKQLFASNEVHQARLNPPGFPFTPFTMPSLLNGQSTAQSSISVLPSAISSLPKTAASSSVLSSASGLPTSTSQLSTGISRIPLKSFNSAGEAFLDGTSASGFRQLNPPTINLDFCRKLARKKGIYIDKQGQVWVNGEKKEMDLPLANREFFQLKSQEKEKGVIFSEPLVTLFSEKKFKGYSPLSGMKTGGNPLIFSELSIELRGKLSNRFFLITPRTIFFTGATYLADGQRRVPAFYAQRGIDINVDDMVSYLKKGGPLAVQARKWALYGAFINPRFRIFASDATLSFAKYTPGEVEFNGSLIDGNLDALENIPYRVNHRKTGHKWGLKYFPSFNVTYQKRVVAG